MAVIGSVGTLNRRSLLAGLGLAGLGFTGMGVPLRAVLAATPVNAPHLPVAFISAYASGLPPAAGQPERYGIAGLGPDLHPVFTAALPGRGHGVAVNPVLGQGVVFARRPGTWFLPVSLADGVAQAPVLAPANRRLTGHGVYSADGRTLFVAEDDVEQDVGMIAVHDVTDGYRRIDSLPAHGLGPHEIVSADDGRVLVVANGGVITHPDTGRAKLNLDEMDASLTYVEAATGRLIEKVRLAEDHWNLGMRHLCVLPDGTVAFGVQNEAPTGQAQPLAGQHRLGSAPQFFQADPAEWTRFDGYIGSVAFHDGIIACSSPRGGVVGLWEASSGKWRGTFALPDVCGLVEVADGIRITSGHGVIATLQAGATGAQELEHARVVTPEWRWDNHIAPLLV